MISCKECSTLNSLDSAYCKSCGKPLAAEDALDAREQLDRRLDDAFELFHHGRTEDAAVIADTALASDPGNVRALSLRAMVLERRGMIAEALEAYEAIVARDPNAALERMKVQTLRGVLQKRLASHPSPNPRIRALVAAAATILVITVGAIAAILSSRPTPVTVAQNEPRVKATLDTFAPAPAAKSEPTKAETKDAKSSETEPGTDSAQPPASRLDADVPANALLPKPTTGDSAEVKPLNPLPTGAEIRPIATPPKTEPAQKSDPEPSEVATAKPETAAGPPPLVDIQLSDPSQKSGTDGAIDANGVEALVRTARGQYQVGNYQAAATTYEKALRAGADAAMVNQRLGQCYDKLGRTSDATAAYNRAITALQNAISQGRGNKQLLMAALESSRQALQNLQGG